jgi:site-specific DNA recombinase
VRRVDAGLAIADRPRDGSVSRGAGRHGQMENTCAVVWVDVADTHRPVCDQRRRSMLTKMDATNGRGHVPAMSKRSGNARLAVAYVRVSTDEQRLGPEAQRAAIEAWAAREGIEVGAWRVDQGVSGGSDLGDRPGLVAALGELRTLGAGLLVVAKRDRLARDVYVAATIERAVAQSGARVTSADGTANGDTPADAFMRTVIDGAAAYERALIRARTKAALAAKRARGERSGELPYGMRLSADGARLEPDAAEQAVLAVVRELRGSGLTQRAIVAELAARGLVSRAGRAFGKTQIVRMLARAAA